MQTIHSHPLIQRQFQQGDGDPACGEPRMVSIWYKPTTTRSIIPFSKQLCQVVWAKAMSVCAIPNEKNKTTKSETYGLARYWFLCWIDTTMRKGICWTWMAPRAPDPLIFQPKWTIIHHMSSLFCDVCLGTVEHGRMVGVFCWCIWWAHGFQHWLKAIRWFFLKPPFGNPSQRLSQVIGLREHFQESVSDVWKDMVFHGFPLDVPWRKDTKQSSTTNRPREELRLRRFRVLGRGRAMHRGSERPAAAARRPTSGGAQCEVCGYEAREEFKV